MENPFRDAIRGSRMEMTKAIDVSDLLLGGLQDEGVLTDAQYDQILVRRFTMCSVYTMFLHSGITSDYYTSGLGL